MTIETPGTVAADDEDRPAAVPGTTHGPDCLTQEQREYLLAGIKPARVTSREQSGRVLHYVEAYDVRAHLTRLFGFANWSQDILETAQTCEYGEDRTRTKKGKEETYTVWTVGYRATVRVTVNCPHGIAIASYTEVAADVSANQPQLGEAHHNALSAAVSTALKRAAANLGDQYGLSLYRKGSTAPLVATTLVHPWDGEKRIAKLGAPDAHIDEQLPREEDASREVSASNEPVDPPAWDDQPPADTSIPRTPGEIKTEAVMAAMAYGPAELKQKLTDLMTELTQIRGHAGEKATVRVFLIQQMKIAEQAMSRVDASG